MLALVDLPHDILIHICTQLQPRDFLTLIQTCRVLHAFAFSDYIWHHIRHDLPMDMSSSRDGRLCSIPAAELHAITRRSLRLHENWLRPTAHLLAISKLQSEPHMVVAMQPLGSDWLVTSHRIRNNLINICVWRLSKDALASCVIRIESENAFSFEAAFREEGGHIAVISVLGASQTDKTKGQLTIYQINLKGHETNEHSLGVPYLMNSRKIERRAVFYYTQISGSIVAAAIVNLVNQPLHQILLYNIQTDATIIMDSPILSAFEASRMLFKLYSPHIVIVGVSAEQIKVHVRELPRKIFSSWTGEETCEEWAASIVDYKTIQIRNVDIYVSPEPIYRLRLTSFTVMAAHLPFSTSHEGVAEIFRFPIDIASRNLTFTEWKPKLVFNMPPNVTLDPTCLGKTGMRAVWLLHRWNFDDYQLMRGSFLDTVNGKAMIAPLAPPDLALPLEPHTCNSMYFEEATGKVWVGLHTGDIFMLQF